MNGEVAITQNFGAVGQFITGVVYLDQNDNDFYDPGEGVSGAKINAEMVNGEFQSPYYAISSESGGYSIPINSRGGNYIVSFSDQIYGNLSVNVTTKDSANEKVDWIRKLKPPQITLRPPRIDASGRLVLIANGPRNRNVIFQFSNDLMKWNDQLTLPLSDGTTTFNVPIQSSPNAPNLFYRLKLVE